MLVSFAAVSEEDEMDDLFEGCMAIALFLVLAVVYVGVPLLVILALIKFVFYT